MSNTDDCLANCTCRMNAHSQNNTKTDRDTTMMILVVCPRGDVRDGVRGFVDEPRVGFFG